MLNTSTLNLISTAIYKDCQYEDRVGIVEWLLAFSALAWNDGCGWNSQDFVWGFVSKFLFFCKSCWKSFYLDIQSYQITPDWLRYQMLYVPTHISSHLTKQLTSAQLQMPEIPSEGFLWLLGSTLLRPITGQKYQEINVSWE